MSFRVIMLQKSVANLRPDTKSIIVGEAGEFECVFFSLKKLDMLRELLYLGHVYWVHDTDAIGCCCLGGVEHKKQKERLCGLGPSGPAQL